MSINRIGEACLNLRPPPQKIYPKWKEGVHEPYTACLWAVCAGASKSVVECLRDNGADRLSYQRTIDGKTFDQVVATVPRYVHRTRINIGTFVSLTNQHWYSTAYFTLRYNDLRAGGRRATAACCTKI